MLAIFKMIGILLVYGAVVAGITFGFICYNKENGDGQVFMWIFLIVAVSILLVPVLFIATGFIKPPSKGSLTQEGVKIQQEENKKFETYSRLYGREKRLRMLRDEIWDLEKKKERALKLPHDMFKAGCFKPKERNWGIAGGIASAIGGLGAGIAVASEIEAENEIMRQKSATEIKNVFSTSEQAYARYNIEIETLREKVEEAETARIDESYDTDKCFELLNCEYESKLDESNNILSVSAAVRLKKHPRFGVVDGCLLATMFVDENKVGETLLVLPLEGVGNVGNHIDTKGKIALPWDFDANTSYSIKITPYSLWVIERI